MPTVNVEMMKQLVQEFTEKETLTAEEIKVIEQQVGELEKRIGVCRTRLQNLNEDKDRLAVMMSRYAGGANLDASRQSLTRDRGKPKPVAKLLDNAGAQTTAEQDLLGLGIEDTSAEAAKSNVAEELDPAAAEDSTKAETEGATGGDDAIKSINDALKGLFRK